MQRMLTDDNRRLVFVPDLGDYHKPTVTELNGAGVVDLSCRISLDGFTLGATGDDEIDDPAYCGSSNSKAPGRTNYEAMVNAYRYKDEADDLVYTTFTRKNIPGYLVERIGQIEEGQKAHETPFKATDKVRVFQVLTGTPRVLSPTKASYEKTGLPFFVQDNVDERAVVTAP